MDNDREPWIEPYEPLEEGQSIIEYDDDFPNIVRIMGRAYLRPSPIRASEHLGPLRPSDPDACWACHHNNWHTWPTGDRVCLTCHPGADRVNLTITPPLASPIVLPDHVDPPPPPRYKHTRAPRPRKEKPTMTVDQAKNAWLTPEERKDQCRPPRAPSTVSDDLPL